MSFRISGDELPPANYLIPFANANVKAKSKATKLKIIKLSICSTTYIFVFLDYA